MPPERPRLVFVTRRPPLPLDNGSRIRAHRLLTGLTTSFDTTLVTIDHPPGSPDGHTPPEELRRSLEGVEVVLTPGSVECKRLGQLRSVVGRGSWSFARYGRPALAVPLAEVVQRRQPCVLHFDDLAVAQLGPFTGNVNVYSAANVEQRLLALGTDVGSPARRLFNAIESRKVGPEEERVWRGMDLVLAVSEVDAQAMGSAGATRVALCPNGADLVHPYPPPRLRPEEPLRLLFVGSGAYRPYERGLAWFVREVIPLLQGRCAARFDVVGQPPRRPVAAPGVTYHGRVPDVTPFYHQAHAVVVPVFEGSGTRLKVVEAVAHGRPVVSTPLGAEGLPLAAGEHYFQSDDPHDFAEALITIGAAYRRLEDPRLRHMLEAARAAIEPLFWPTIVKNLITLYRAQLEALEGRTTDPGPGR